jgi:hypothetical protein
LFNIHKYISSVHNEHSTDKNNHNNAHIQNVQEKSNFHTNIQSLQQQRIDSIQKHFETTVQERENEMKQNIPPNIDFKDENIDKYNVNTIKLLETEIESREKLISPSQSQNEKYVWLDDMQINNGVMKLKLPNNIDSCIINRVFFMNLNNTTFSIPDYIQLKTSNGQMSWFFKYNNTKVLHYTGEMNIYTNETDIYIHTDNSTNINDVQVFLQVKL